ncbi:uncharacterized protein LOC110973176 isoform X2 [Acanthaster planci]|uniref:Uncharacterized protein LOC110973176 isoform X2 n=1 Tax=Acanthaster planci TaxID=133434 RepID=A0A8B7XH02_ACAPL|nr:uncharacterized protein LOC110973176 isoform X2 [Acanthaster planci]
MDEEKTLKDLQYEVDQLVKENQRLKRCVRGVKVVGRALQEAKKEVKYLQRQVNEGLVPSSGTVHPSDDGGTVPCFMVPPKSDVSPTAENVLEKACQRETLVEHRVNEHQVADSQGLIGDVGKGAEKPRNEKQYMYVGEDEIETNPQLEPVQIEDTGKTWPITNQAGKDRTTPEGNDEKPAVEADQDVTDIDAVEELLKELPTITTSSASDKATPRDVMKWGEKSTTTITNAGDGFAVKTLVMQEKSSLQSQLKELKKVNLDWGRFCKEQTSRFVTQLAEKDKAILKLQKQIDEASMEATRRANQYDQMLLAAKTRIDKVEEQNKELQCQLDSQRNRAEKSDQLSRNLARQNKNMTDEIARLKEALERKHLQKPNIRQSPTLPVQLIKLQPHTSREADQKEVQSPQTEANPTAPQSHTQPPPIVESCSAFVPLPLSAPTDEVPAAGKISKHETGAPISPNKTTQPAGRKPANGTCASASVNWKGTNEIHDEAICQRSYTKEELKEQVELLRQQNQMFESDFKKENADKMRAMDKLQNLQRELGKSKGRLEGYGHRNKAYERDLQRPGVVKSSEPVRGPKEQMYKPPSEDRGVKPHKTNRKSKPVAKDSKEMTVVHVGGHTCTLAQPGAIIIQAEPEGQRLNINLLGVEEGKAGKKRRDMEPFMCPRCQRIFKGTDWESYEYHIVQCNI